MWSNKNIIEFEKLISYRNNRSAMTRDWDRCPIANCDEGRQMRETGKKYTIIGAHVIGRASVEDPETWSSAALKCHLV